jgi:hypothetical protein
MPENLIGKNANFSSLSVDLHEAFVAIVTECVSNLLNQSTLLTYGSLLFALIFDQLKEKCHTVSVSQVGTNNFPDCELVNKTSYSLDKDFGTKQTIKDVALLERLVRKLLLNDNHELQTSLPLSIDDFAAAIQKEPFKMTNLPES